MPALRELAVVAGIEGFCTNINIIIVIILLIEKGSRCTTSAAIAKTNSETVCTGGVRSSKLYSGGHCLPRGGEFALQCPLAIEGFRDRVHWRTCLPKNKVGAVLSKFTKTTQL